MSDADIKFDAEPSDKAKELAAIVLAEFPEVVYGISIPCTVASEAASERRWYLRRVAQRLQLQSLKQSQPTPPAVSGERGKAS
jgi:hypothetical protein